MRYSIALSLLILITACREESATDQLTAQQIVDRAIEVSGGNRYTSSHISFDFRDKSYSAYREGGQRVLVRLTQTDTALIEDKKMGNDFERRINDSLISLADTTAIKFANSVNSVHYFAYLPYSLNDKAVIKELLGKVSIGDGEYYKIRVTFNQEGGGMDFEDTFVYWFNTETFRPDFIAYEYHTDGGGLRFREAFNDREVGGILFQDYRNFKPEGREGTPVTSLDSLFKAGKLELLSEIILENVVVNPDSYN